MSVQLCDTAQNLCHSKQYVPHPSVDNFLITRLNSDGYSRPLVVWCVAARETSKMRKTLEELYYGNLRPSE